MSAKYHNVMEDLVEMRLTEIYPTLDCCTCEQCRNDIVAFALNQLPCKYVVTRVGEAYSKLYTLQQQHDTDIVSAITQGTAKIREYPRHDL